MTAANSTTDQTAGKIASSDVLRTLMDTARECVLVVDEDTRIFAMNDAACGVFSRRGEEIEHKRLSEVVRDAGLYGAFLLALNEGHASDMRLELVGSEKKKFDVHIAPLQLDGRQLAIGFFYDITKLERLETVRQEFLSNISHELRTPLTSIIAFVETLEDGAIDDAENNRRFLGVIRRNAERMHMLISDILELSLIESGKVSIEVREVRLSPLVNDIFASLSSRAEERRIQLTNNVPADYTVNADSHRLEQILVNLIDNAIKFNRDEGSVTVSVETRGNMDVISVADTGEGIMPEHLKRIFERFYRTDRARSRHAGGTGLGLAIVKHLARLHGGEVFVTSELGRGTTFFVEFPHQTAAKP